MSVSSPRGYQGIVSLDLNTPISLYSDHIVQEPSPIRHKPGFEDATIHVAYRDGQRLGTCHIMNEEDGTKRVVCFRPELKRFEVPVHVNELMDPVAGDPGFEEKHRWLAKLGALKGRQIIHGDLAVYELCGNQVIGTYPYLMLEDGTPDTPQRHKEAARERVATYLRDNGIQPTTSAD